MDGSQFCCCGLQHKCTNSELNDESRFAETHCSIFGKSRPPRISHTIWKRNSLTCKPWRRKSLVQVILTRTCSQALFWFKLLILVTSVFQGVLNVWQWTTSAKSRILLVILIGGLRLPLASCQESLQPSLSDGHQLFDQVVYVGSMFSYTIFERAFDCKVDTLVVTEASDRFLSHWLAYNEKKKQLYGVPSHKDKGKYDILVVALAKDERVRGQVCGSKSFSITVLPLSEELPISVYAVGGSHDYGQKSVPNMLCTPGVQVILGTVILDTHLQNLNGHERVKVIVKMAKHLNVDSNKLKLFSGEVSHPLIEQLDSPVVIAAGAGDRRFSKGPRTLLTWNIGCGAMKLEDADLSILEVNAQDGTITDLLGFPVVGWHIMSGSQKSVVKHHRFRRQVGVQATPTPTMSSLLPTHISTISTSVIVSKSVTPSLSTYSTSSSISLFKSSLDVSSRTQNRSDVQSSSNVTRGVSSQVSSSPVPSSPISMTIISLTVNGSSPLQSANRTTATVISSAEGFTVNSTVLVSPSVITSPSLSLTITLSQTTIFTSTSTSPPVSTAVFTTGSPLVSTPNSTVKLVSSTDRLSSMNRTTTLFNPSGAISSVSNVTSVIPVTNINSSMVTMTTFSNPPNTTVLISSSSLLANQTVILSTSFTPTLLSSTTVSPSQNSSGGFTNSSVPQTSTVSTMSENLRSTSNSSATLKTTGSFLSVTSLVSNVTSLSNSRSVNLSASLPLTTSLSSARLSSTPSIQSSSETIVTNSSISLGPSNSSALKRTFTMSLSSFLVPSLSASAVSSQSSFENSSTIMSSTLPALNTTVVNTASTISTTMTSSMQQSLKITSYTVLQSVNKSSSREITSMKRSVSTQLSSASSFVENSTSAPNSTLATVIFTRTTLQPFTQSSSVVIILSSLTSSPLITSVNVTSLVKSLNTSIGTLPSSFVFPSSNFTPTSTVTNATKTIVPTSTAIPNSAPTVYNNIARLTAPAGKALYYTIPEDTFYDKEDQANTRKLALTVSFANGTAIPPDFWLQFDNETQTIYGLPMNTHVPSGISGIEFVMRARDSRGAVAYDAFEVLVISSDSAVVQKLTVRFSNDFEDFSSNVSQRLLLLQKIAEYYGDSDMSALRVSAFTSGSVVMTWSNDTLPTDTCDEEKVQYVKDKIFLPSGEIREEFKAALEGFPAENGNHQLLGVCNDSAVIPPATFAPLKDSSSEGDLWFKLVLVGVIIVLLIIVLACLLVWHLRRKRPKPLQPEKRTYRKRKPIVLDQEIEMKPISGKPIVLPDDDPSHPPSYLSETSLNKPWNVSDDEDEVDYGKRPPPIYREHSPQSYSEPRDSPPPVYMLPPMYEGSYC